MKTFIRTVVLFKICCVYFFYSWFNVYVQCRLRGGLWALTKCLRIITVYPGRGVLSGCFVSLSLSLSLPLSGKMKRNRGWLCWHPFQPTLATSQSFVSTRWTVFHNYFLSVIIFLPVFIFEKKQIFIFPIFLVISFKFLFTYFYCSWITHFVVTF